MVNKQLLEILLSNYPLETQQKVSANFASVNSNFEFFAWIPKDKTQEIADDANERGFVTWGNIDATSAILYGAGLVSNEAAADTFSWLEKITVPGQECLICQENPGSEPRIISVKKPK